MLAAFPGMNGSVITASADEHPDLFWALHGGGGNFGVATALTFRLHPVGPEVLGGLLLYEAERGVELMRLARDPAQRGQAAPILPTQVAQMLQVQPPSIETAEAGAETIQTSPPSQNGDMPSRGWQLLP